VNAKIPNYKIVRQIGAGGMGAVYEAVHEQIQRRAAIKVLQASVAGDQEMVQRFLNEARAVNIVSHPSLVSIFEFGQASDGSPYIVMEYLEGETLRQRLTRVGKMKPAQAINLARQMASALGAAHAKGIIHRDLKPVMFQPRRKWAAVPQAGGDLGEMKTNMNMKMRSI